MKKTTIQVITLGCAKNLVDSEKILARLPADRYEIVDEGAGPADTVIINTCGFINDAREESIDAILRAVGAKEHGAPRRVIVTGCLSERYMDELPREIPEVDGWFGARDPSDLFRYLNAPYDPLHTDRVLRTPPHYAYLKIAEGCDRTCSFCAIPMIRGAYRSLPPGLLAEECRKLAGKGVREIILVAQDLSYYGRDLRKKDLLADLLRRILAIPGIEWIRLHYAYPHHFPDAVLEMMAAEPRICNYLDLPIQHINDEVLLSMRRGHDKTGTLRFLQAIREKVPGIALRTTLLVGYPTETEEAFRELVDFVTATRFERLGVFTYSPEEGTPAYALGDPIPERTKTERAETIMDLQAGISLDNNHLSIGKTVRAIIDGEENGRIIARTEHDSPEVDNELILTGMPGQILPPGTFVTAHITDASAYELYGKVIAVH